MWLFDTPPSAESQHLYRAGAGQLGGVALVNGTRPRASGDLQSGFLLDGFLPG